MKDKSYKVAIDDLFGAPNYLQNIYLDSEIFDLRLSNFAGNKHAKTNKEKHNLILMKSENGDAESSLQLAFTSYYGLHGQRVNMSQSFEYFYRAMLQGDQTAESFVGLMYYQGLGVDQNLKKAYDIFVAGEQKKNYNCFNGLGLMYLRGDYVQKDLAQAYKLFKSTLPLS